MRKIKNIIVKTSLLSLSLSLSLSLLGAAYADNPDSNTAGNNASGFGISLTGLYLQPGASNLDYAVNTHPAPPASAPTWNQEWIEPKYNGAFDLNLNYTMQDQVDQISLDWLHLSNSESASINTDGVTESAAPPWAFGPGAQVGGQYATGTAKFDVDNGNLLFSHLINLSNHFQIKPFAGLSTAQLKEDLTSTYTGIAPDADDHPYTITSYEDSKFLGVGPRLGLDGTYLISQNFGLTAEMGGSLLTGSMKSTTNFDAYGSGNLTTAHTALADDSRVQVVPEVDSKLGLSYQMAFKSGADFSVQAGYMISAYIDGINQVVPSQMVPDSFNHGVVALAASDQEESNLDLNGPYLTLALTF